jgi:hypothetical protein
MDCIQFLLHILIYLFYKFDFMGLILEIWSHKLSYYT